jgi:single-strand DNA-binding protein
MSLYATGVVRLLTDPQLKTFDSGNMVANFAGGINEGKDKNGAYIQNVIDCELWGNSAQIVCDKLRKGDCVQLSGAIRMQEWNDKDGNKRRKHVFSAQRFEFLPRQQQIEEVPF